MDETAMVTLISKVKKYFDEISEKLRKQENKWGNILKDRYNKTFHSQNYEKKEILFNGI